MTYNKIIANIWLSQFLIDMKMIKNFIKDSLISNSIFLIMATFFNSFLGYLFWIMASRYYTPDNIGIISAILSSSGLVSIISSMGLPIAIIFYLPREKNNINRIMDTSIITTIVVSIIFSMIFILGLKFWTSDLKVLNNLRFSIIFIIMTVMTSLSVLINDALIAGRKSSYSMFKDNIFNTIKILLLITFAGFGIIGFFLSLTIGLIVTMILGFFLLYKTWSYIPKLVFDPIIKKMAKFSFENYIASILYFIPKFILPIVMVGIISSEKTGYFYIAFTATGLLHGISQSISTSLLVESYDTEKFKRNIKKAILFNAGILIPGMLIFIIFGKFILNIFNPNYAENAINVLIILTIASIPVSVINIFNCVRASQNKTRSIIKMNFIVALMTIILSIQFMKTMGIEGAATGFLVANIIGMMIIIYNVRDFNVMQYIHEIIYRKNK